MRPKRVPGHPDGVSTYVCPLFAEHFLASNFIQNKHNVLQPRKQLRSACDIYERRTPQAGAWRGAHGVHVTARMLNMHHNKARVSPGLAPNTTASH